MHTTAEPNRLQHYAAQIRFDAAHRRVRDFPRDVQAALMSEWEEGVSPRGAGEDRHHRHVLSNARLNGRADELVASHARVAFDEHSITLKAKYCAHGCLLLKTLTAAERYCRDQNIEPPEEKGHTERGRYLRMCDERWWRRRLHRYYSRRAEGALRDMGLVHKRKGLYCSDATLNRRTEQKKRQREMMREVVAINDLGEQLTLFELAKASVSNPAVRRAELMTRIRGFEECAVLADHVAEFYTFTAPSRFHAYGVDGVRNDKHTERLTPRDAQRWLRDCWARIRAKLARLSIRIYGFRVAEPHHDGTTHWHLLLFVQQRHRQTVRQVCAGHLLADSGDEPGANKHRFVAVSIDAAKGTAAGYVAKYVAKNIDGFEVGEDFESAGANADDTAKRVDAWASTWGIRQFQQIGGPPVGIWRELRRIDGSVESESKTIERARAAADAGEWADFIDAFGGIEVGQRGEIELEKNVTGECNQYSELKAAVVAGVKRGLTIIITRVRQWVFAFIESCDPWTRVNNCTASNLEEYELSTATRPP